MMVGVISYGMGNLSSVVNAFENIGSRVQILSDPPALSDVSRIVLPGVGAFRDGMENLRSGGWITPLEDSVFGAKKPFLGLCLGMQLLASRGTEHGDWCGLNWVPGTVRRLTPCDSSIRIPHIGWNNVEIVKECGLYRGAARDPAFYFVHSYVFEPVDPGVVSSYCTHGERFPASIECGNIFGTQFHPEKSQKCGLALLRNFLAL
jgi:glutamine amidotransferase